MVTYPLLYFQGIRQPGILIESEKLISLVGIRPLEIISSSKAYLIMSTSIFSAALKLLKTTDFKNNLKKDIIAENSPD